jgi:hypothetical protein
MAVFTTIRRETLNARAYFVPVGETVGAVTVAKEDWPVVADESDIEGYQLHDVESIKVEKEYDSEIVKIPGDRGYIDDEEKTLKKVSYLGTTSKTNSLLKKLEHGLVTIPVVGTPQAIHASSEDYVEGVAYIYNQNKSGTTVETITIWARIRLTDSGEVGPNMKKLTYSLEKRDSSLNSYELVA